ncbi:RNA polymerase factor sigma C [Salipaludibacillus neizhouensis]|uniref:RNA polymerase factor sigma C n=1 Tax=Salipaludibacillus neizhouensis TaxID=885475 RepID=A0A3A9K4M7_9BACI|nr:sigma-70 family RNA polymerase sigma factor [Salipaludibacillus neizhouensis]RKL67279.1 RNA polymerase factor sigma C [Salipaludibacillus neizhouensis]
MDELEQLVVTEESRDDREEIIAQLMSEYSDGILHLVYTYVKNRATAEDLTQEIFIKSYEKLSQFNQQSSIKTWVYRIASNHCKDYLKSWHYRKIVLNEKFLDYIPSKSKHIDEEIIAKDEENCLSNAVMALPVKYREVVFLHYYEELSLAEINKVTTVNINTLKTRLKRAKELLKDKMTEEV